MDHNIYKRGKRLTERVWCTKGKGSAWWGVRPNQPRERCWWTKAQGVDKPETNLLGRQSRKGFDADALLRLTLGYQLNHVWKKPKDLQWAKPNTFQIDWTIHFEEKIPKNLETLLFYTKKTLACCYRKQLPAREGDSWARSRLHYLFLIQNHSMLAWRTFDAARGALTFFRLTREENGIA